jgi:hypothetical protein
LYAYLHTLMSTQSHHPKLIILFGESPH